MIHELTAKGTVAYAVQIEGHRGRFYQKLSQKFPPEPAPIELYEALAKNEATHKKLLNRILASQPVEIPVPDLGERYEMLRAMSLSEFFNGDIGLYKRLRRVRTPNDALEETLELEKDTLAYYQAMQDIIGCSVELGDIIEDLKEHLLTVMDYTLSNP